MELPMNNETNNPRIKEDVEPKDLIKMQTEVGLIESMLQSKTLTAIVIIAIILLGGFFMFLSKVTG
ncbi:hypothetical protein CWB58_19750 [Pseudoalteromonas sp. S201]|jgi:hypothetical protein|uniref:Uncharacterized protein n=2 Tax=Pseudoalteromonas TaxID=53246 RepID=A0A4P9J1C3_9GAMM|nr:hypothetical protein [Pseudoalteromonas sp. SG45-3]MBB1360521.1 hypothetical protein [Pseudoalteromonas sp. SG45-6]MBB1450339.1 hypothetical protein [Pseudoalteromonas sp. SG43-1]QCU74672.1 hypothetical protein FFU37_09435 [Pseudoalteromonas distincta]TMS90829.1 hypothetical protein CWB58_19750 [Pseudoalteromonas sp. S201]TVU75996.1 hypothetical protein FQP81_07500 [Pseudoalteromonas elyakovii]HAG41721.1 hypothetical protein [Pseudoalteromonas sp.]|tara:strand:- start:1350 stop:1547 length:198 start_codon:yes stop_codon:yes gene_type:complete